MAPWGHSQTSRWTHSLLVGFFFSFPTQGAVPKIAGNSFPCPSTGGGGGGGEAVLTFCFPKFQGMGSARAGRKGEKGQCVPRCLLSVPAEGWSVAGCCRGFLAGFWDFSHLQFIIWCPAWCLSAPCWLCSELCPSRSDGSSKIPLPCVGSQLPSRISAHLLQTPQRTEPGWALGHPNPPGAHRPHPQAAPDGI